MKRMLYVVIAAVVLMSAALMYSPTQAETTDAERQERMMKRATERVDDMLDDIDATDVQRAQAHIIKDQLLNRVPALRDSGKTLRATMVEELLSEKTDAERIHASLDSMSTDATAFAHHAVESMAQMHAILTPEQREEIAGRFDRERRDFWMVEAFADRGLERALDRIDATDEQRTLAERRFDGLLANTLTQLNGFQDDRAAWLALWRAERFDVERAHSLIDSRSRAITSYVHNVVGFGLEFYATMNSEQREMIASRLNEWKARWR